MKWPQKILMVSPEAFRVEYAINAHMRNAAGELNTVDVACARKQWEELKQTYQRLGCEVVVLPAVQKFPDLVFCANQTFPFLGPSKKPSVILSHMHSPERKGEVEYLKAWCQEHGIQTFELNSSEDFEGCGDLLWNYEAETLFGGYGYRTSEKIYREIESIVQKPVVTLRLTNEKFYHLDTCLAILGRSTACYVKEAFDEEGLQKLRANFEDLIQISLQEAIHNFAGNCHTPDGRHVILHKGAGNFVKDLTARGFIPVEVDTSEYMKSGGSVFCMKQVLF